MMKKKITYLVLVLSTCLLVGCGAVSETEESENFSTVEETAEMAEGTEGIPEGSGEMSEGTTEISEETGENSEETADKVQEEELVVEVAETVLTDEEMRDGEDDQNVETPADYYAVATSLPASEVEAFVLEIRQNIQDKDWAALSAKINYPITISGVTVNDSDEFLELDFDQQINAEFVTAIEAETCRQMFSNWQGISMGEAGQIWIGSIVDESGASVLRIIGLNGMLQESLSDADYDEKALVADTSNQAAMDKLTVEEAWELLKENYTYLEDAELEEISYDENSNFQVIIGKDYFIWSDETFDRYCESLIFFNCEEDGCYQFGHHYVYYEEDENTVFATQTKGWFEVDYITGEVTRW